MTTPKTDPWALLHEAQPHVAFNVARNPQTDTGLLARIDAALAEVNPCRLIDVGDSGMSRERAEADAFRRGVKAMRDAAVAVARKRADLPKHSDLDSAWCRSAECILDELRNLPDPEDK